MTENSAGACVYRWTREKLLLVLREFSWPIFALICLHRGASNIFLFNFQISKEHYKALTVITYVGCGISLFGLALTLATFLSLE